MTQEPFDIIATQFRFTVSPVAGIEVDTVDASRKFRNEWAIGDIQGFYLSFRNWGQSTGRSEEWSDLINDKPDNFYGQFLLSERGPTSSSWQLEINLGSDGYQQMKDAIDIIGCDQAIARINVSRTNFADIGSGYLGALIAVPPMIEVMKVYPR